MDLDLSKLAFESGSQSGCFPAGTATFFYFKIFDKESKFRFFYVEFKSSVLAMREVAILDFLPVERSALWGHMHTYSKFEYPKSVTRLRKFSKSLTEQLCKSRFFEKKNFFVFLLRKRSKEQEVIPVDFSRRL